MSNYNSQEQTIYRNLAGKIQLGFYDGGERFPSAKEIASGYQVSYCPAQRALKMLEKDGLIKLCRGKATQILAKPYEDYLGNPVFLQRSAALLDLCEGLKLISPAICFHSLHALDYEAFSESPKEEGTANAVRSLYLQFDQALHAIGSQTALNLYYDVGSFVGSAFLDIFCSPCGKEETMRLWQEIENEYRECAIQFKANDGEAFQKRLDRLNHLFFDRIIQYLKDLPAQEGEQIPFVWEPHKGRTRYCDFVAIDMICKISQKFYPVGTLLPNGAVLADIYHVSEITIRRTISLMNQLGVTQTFNGVGTRVISEGDASIPRKLKDLTLDSNLRSFLDAIQLLTILAEPVMCHTFPHIPADTLNRLAEAVGQKGQKKAMVAAIGMVLQTVVRFSPLASLREIYSKLTHLLLVGSILRLDETGEETVPGWPEIASSIREGCRSSRSDILAHACRALFENCFASTKLSLLEIGVQGVEDIVGFD
ncbi:GntR family transcriptional regulator [Eisenbergiella tayi]|uniref:DNA-binding transcriptional repressor ExuR n=1 Tax=Eisenbergiella tayi TaxID=1432052 RepID=A0A1E3AFS5_9FIRM|nr:GntR family transcriptional regulator [Eisenbergiella tayi]ODM07271.1 DNA-binding transcriptional repressor ExuR [Eisenbergiella tayi]